MTSKPRATFGGGTGRFSLAPASTIKTPTRPRLTYNAQTPSGIRNSTTRFSIGGAQSANKRLSMFKVPTSSAIPKDTNDKATQARMAKKIYNFLNKFDGDEAVPEAKILNPQTKDFILIFEQIYECIAPEYEYPKERKLTEEIPRIFTELGYPHIIKASTLQTIGASHSWHYLLHALSWLVDFVQKPLSITAGSQVLLTGHDENANVKAYHISWLTKGFREYQANRNVLEYTDYIDKSVKQVKDYFENNENINGQVKNTEQYLDRIRQEINELKSEQGMEEHLREDIRKVEEDIKKVTSYICGAEPCALAGKSDKEAAETDVKEIKSEVDSLKDRVAQMKVAVVEQEKNKGIKADKAQVIMLEHNQLKHQLRESQSELEHLSKEQWMNQPKANEAFSEVISQARKIVGVVKSVGEMVNYSFKHFDENNIKNSRELHNALVHDLRQDYDAIRNALRAAIQVTEKEINVIASNIAHNENRSQMEGERLVDVQRRLQKKALRFQQFNEEAKSERRNQLAVIEKLENEKEILLNRQKGMSQLMKELEFEEGELIYTLREAQTRKEEFENRLMDSGKQAFEAIKIIQNERTRLERTILAHINDWTNICP